LPEESASAVISEKNCRKKKKKLDNKKVQEGVEYIETLQMNTVTRMFQTKKKL